MRKNSNYIRIYILWMNLIFLIIIPFLVLIILNTIIYIKIKGFEKRSRENEASQFQLRVTFPKHDLCEGSSKTISTLDSSLKSLISPKTSLPGMQRRKSTQSPAITAELANEKTFIAKMNSKKNNTASKPSSSFGPITQTSVKGSKNDDLQMKLKNDNQLLLPNTLQNYHDESANDMQQSNSDLPNPTTQQRLQIESELVNKFQNKQRCKSEAHIMNMDVRKRRSIIERMHMRILEKSSSNNIVSVRKRELVLARISIYIVFVMLLCHSVRLIPNTYEMIQTYTQVSYLRS